MDRSRVVLRLTDDQRLKNEGKLDQATGKMKKAAERAIDKAKG